MPASAAQDNLNSPLIPHQKYSLYDEDLDAQGRALACHRGVTELHCCLRKTQPDWVHLAQAFPDLRVLHVSADNAQLATLAALPNIEQLDITCTDEVVAVELAASSALQKFQLTLQGTKQLSLDLRAASQLEVVSVRMPNGDTDQTVAVNQLAMPDSLKEVTIELPQIGRMPLPFIGCSEELRLINVNLQQGDFPAEMLGEARRVGRLTLRQSQRGQPLSAALLRNLTSVDDLVLDLKDSECSADLFPAQLVLHSLIYANSAQGRVNMAQWRLPHLRKAELFAMENGPFGDDQLMWLAHSPQLTELEVRNFQTRYRTYEEQKRAPVVPMPKLPALPQLKSLTLIQCHGEDLSRYTGTLPKLEAIELYSCRLDRLGDPTAFAQLRSFYVNQQAHVGEMAPELDELCHLPCLEAVHVQADFVNDDAPMALALLPAKCKVTVYFDNNGRISEVLEKIIKLLASAQLPLELRQDYFRRLFALRAKRQIPAEEDRYNLTLLEGRYSPFKKAGQQWLRQISDTSVAELPLGPDTCLFVCGRSGFKAAQLQAKADEIGFTLCKTLDERVTHILVGASPKNTHLFDSASHRLIDDSALQDLFEQQTPQFLQQPSALDSGMVESVLAMLASPDEASHRVAVEMLKQGGVTEAMWMPLFLILKTSTDPQLRESIKGLLAGHGDALFQLAVNDRVLFNDVRGRDKESNDLKCQGPMLKRIKTVSKRWGEAVSGQFALAYFERFGEGLLYLLQQKTDSAERQQAIQWLVEGSRLDWNKGCGFNHILNGGLGTDLYQPDDRQLYHWLPGLLDYRYTLGKSKTQLPVELAEQITDLNLENCYLDVLPKGFEQFTKLTKLNCQFNHLDKLPAKFGLLTELEELDLSYNHFDEFPKVLLKLKKLKRLDLRRAKRPDTPDRSPNYQNDQELEVPEAFRQQLPDCVILIND
ncbi:hypothetical protein [Ferrimonas pelagia]|uniref:Uncharacterized protein n=1 Tax=Ferrimonas pelagia TaxID=1177826 RepID=A0ABP9EVF2_9GAMM